MGVTSPAPSGCAPGPPLERTRAWRGHKGPPRVPSRTAMSLGCFRDASDSSTLSWRQGDGPCLEGHRGAEELDLNPGPSSTKPGSLTVCHAQGQPLPS